MDFTSYAGNPMLGRQILGVEGAVIDDKGRVRIPSRQKEAIGQDFVIAVVYDGCLGLYPQEVWNRKIAEIIATPASHPARDAHLREVGAFAEQGMKFDPQGRFVIPQGLRDVTGMNSGEVLLVGCVDHLEIWRKEDFAKYRQNPEEYMTNAKRQELMEKLWKRLMEK
ncbi:MAG TPA: hypothetical protein VNK96_05830 [Fimbriimonadales bacterium]|nr:hypothetical protein [Fimbriimonadales bacterium]